MTELARPKIALLLRGHVRSYATCYPVLKQLLLDKYDTDIFLHSWDANQSVLDLYKPKVAIVEEYADQSIVSKISNSWFQRQKPSFRNQIYCNYVLAEQLKNHAEKESKTYDLVIFLRFDIMPAWNFSLVIDQMLSEILVSSKVFCVRPLAQKGNKYADLAFMMDYASAVHFGAIVPFLINRKTTYSTLIYLFIQRTGVHVIYHILGLIKR